MNIEQFGNTKLPEYKTIYYGKHLSVLDRDTNLVCAKEIHRIDTDPQSIRYFIKLNNNRLCNPFQDTRHFNTKYIKVNKETYETYLRFLKTGGHIHYSYTERLL